MSDYKRFYDLELTLAKLNNQRELVIQELNKVTQEIEKEKQEKQEAEKRYAEKRAMEGKEAGSLQEQTNNGEIKTDEVGISK